MNLIEKWKNRETKKKLHDENIRLKAQLEVQWRTKYPVVTIHRNIHAVKGAFHTTRYGEMDIPAEYREEISKEQIKRDMIQYLEPFIEYDFKSNSDGGMDYIGTLYVSMGDGK